MGHSLPGALLGPVSCPRPAELHPSNMSAGVPRACILGMLPVVLRSQGGLPNAALQVALIQGDCCILRKMTDAPVGLEA